MTMKNGAKFEEELAIQFSSRLTWGIWEILHEHSKISKKLQFNGLLLTKVYNIWAKKV